MTPPDKQSQLIDRLYKAYFEEGVNLGDVDALVELASSIGVTNEPDTLKMQLLQGEGLQYVEAGQQSAQKLGIRGVPFYVINEKTALSGLQSPADFIRAFDRQH